MLALLLATSLGTMNDPAVMKSTQAQINLEKTKWAIMKLTTKNKGIEFFDAFSIFSIGLVFKSLPQLSLFAYFSSYLCFLASLKAPR